MPRRKRSSRVLEKADKRAAALMSIAPDLDLGNDLTLASYLEQIGSLRDQLTLYNATLSNVDQYHNDVTALEQAVGDLSEQMLLAVAVKYGKNSNEYEMAGGIRKQDRKRPVRRATAA
ncbi:MAG: hypothetical protein ACKO7W_04155 [Elainella sp.]